jgi:hypothetical protein
MGPLLVCSHAPPICCAVPLLGILWYHFTSGHGSSPVGWSYIGCLSSPQAGICRVMTANGEEVAARRLPDVQECFAGTSSCAWRVVGVAVDYSAAVVVAVASSLIRLHCNLLLTNFMAVPSSDSDSVDAPWKGACVIHCLTPSQQHGGAHVGGSCFTTITPLQMPSSTSTHLQVMWFVEAHCLQACFLFLRKGKFPHVPGAQHCEPTAYAAEAACHSD